MADEQQQELVDDIENKVTEVNPDHVDDTDKLEGSSEQPLSTEESETAPKETNDGVPLPTEEGKAEDTNKEEGKQEVSDTGSPPVPVKEVNRSSEHDDTADSKIEEDIEKHEVMPTAKDETPIITTDQQSSPEQSEQGSVEEKEASEDSPKAIQAKSSENPIPGSESIGEKKMNGDASTLDENGRVDEIGNDIGQETPKTGSPESHGKDDGKRVEETEESNGDSVQMTPPASSNDSIAERLDGVETPKLETPTVPNNGNDVKTSRNEEETLHKSDNVEDVRRDSIDGPPNTSSGSNRAQDMEDESKEEHEVGNPSMYVYEGNQAVTGKHLSRIDLATSVLSKLSCQSKYKNDLHERVIWIIGDLNSLDCVEPKEKIVVLGLLKAAFHTGALVLETKYSSEGRPIIEAAPTLSLLNGVKSIGLSTSSARVQQYSTVVHVASQEDQLGSTLCQFVNNLAGPYRAAVLYLGHGGSGVLQEQLDCAARVNLPILTVRNEHRAEASKVVAKTGGASSCTRTNFPGEKVEPPQQVFSFPLDRQGVTVSEMASFIHLQLAVQF